MRTCDVLGEALHIVRRPTWFGLGAQQLLADMPDPSVHPGSSHDRPILLRRHSQSILRCIARIFESPQSKVCLGPLGLHVPRTESGSN